VTQRPAAIHAGGGAATMATMISEVYDAFRKAGTPEAEALETAEAMATYDPRLAKIETDVTLLKWMVDFNIALTSAVMLRVFLH
jgi:hypothetical protein